MFRVASADYDVPAVANAPAAKAEPELDEVDRLFIGWLSARKTALTASQLERGRP